MHEGLETEAKTKHGHANTHREVGHDVKRGFLFVGDDLGLGDFDGFLLFLFRLFFLRAILLLVLVVVSSLFACCCVGLFSIVNGVSAWGRIICNGISSSCSSSRLGREGILQRFERGHQQLVQTLLRRLMVHRTKA